MSDYEQLAFACPPAPDAPVSREMLVLADGFQTPLFHYRPQRPGGPAVLYIHGIQSHPGWFAGSAQALARAGSEVFQVVRRGSGATVKARGDAASAGQLLDDVDVAVRYVLETTGAKRLALLGVSWGGKLLTAYALTAAECVDSLTLAAPGLVSRVDVSARTKLAILAARCLRPGRYFDIPLNDVSLFTDNPAMLEYLRNDAHRLRRGTARFLFASAMLDRLIARADERALKMPTTLVLAGRDRIIDNAATCAVLERLTDRPAHLRWLNAAHTIEFEPEPHLFHEILCQAVRGGNTE